MQVGKSTTVTEAGFKSKKWKQMSHLNSIFEIYPKIPPYEVFISLYKRSEMLSFNYDYLPDILQSYTLQEENAIWKWYFLERKEPSTLSPPLRNECLRICLVTKILISLLRMVLSKYPCSWLLSGPWTWPQDTFQRAKVLS